MAIKNVEKDIPKAVNVFNLSWFLIDWDSAKLTKITSGINGSHSYCLNIPFENKEIPIIEFNKIVIKSTILILFRPSRSFIDSRETDIDKDSNSKLKELKKLIWDKVNTKKVIVVIIEIIIEIVIDFFNLTYF